MARLNPKRRRERLLHLALIELGRERNPSIVAQSGHIRSSRKDHKVNEAFAVPLYARSPKPMNFDGSGKKGKVVQGKFVPQKGKKPFSLT
jgi:hypothetical protein